MLCLSCQTYFSYCFFSFLFSNSFHLLSLAVMRRSMWVASVLLADRLDGDSLKLRTRDIVNSQLSGTCSSSEWERRERGASMFHKLYRKLIGSVL